MSYRATSTGASRGEDTLRELLDRVAVLERNQNLAGVSPTGAIHLFAGGVAPAGWALCDGASYPKANPLYAPLFAVIGVAYGSADGAHFNVPDMRGRVAAGLGTHTDVNTLGKNEGTALVADRRPRHPTSHALTATPNLTLPMHGHSDTIGFTDSGHGHSDTIGFTDTGHDHPLPGSIVLDDGGGGTTVGSPAADAATVFSGSTGGGAAALSKSGGVDTGFANLSKSGSVGNPTSNPAIPGTIAIGGTIGVAGTTADAPAYLVVQHIIKL